MSAACNLRLAAMLGSALVAVAVKAQDHSQPDHGTHPAGQPHSPVPALTEADRAAAFPPVQGHAMGDNSVHSFLLIEQLEGWDAGEGAGVQWEAQGWLGTDLDRAWLRTEGERSDGTTEAANLELLYGRSIAAWWDLVAGLRHDSRPGEQRSFVALGVQGLAPQRFEIEATAYLGEHGHSAARLTGAYDLLLTNRLILEPMLELNLYGKDDPARGIGSGLSTAEAALRLRYEFTRRFAPYAGLVYQGSYGDTADLRRSESEPVHDTRFVIGLRTWF